MTIRFQSFYVNLRTVQRVEKELDEPYGDYDKTVAQKTLLWSFWWKKKTKKKKQKKKHMWISCSDQGHDWLIGWLALILESQCFHSLGHSSFWVSYQAVRKGRYSLFLIQDENRRIIFFITEHEVQENRSLWKPFEQIQVYPLTNHSLINFRWCCIGLISLFISMMRDISDRIRSWIRR